VYLSPKLSSHNDETRPKPTLTLTHPTLRLGCGGPPADSAVDISAARCASSSRSSCFFHTPSAGSSWGAPPASNGSARGHWPLAHPSWAHEMTATEGGHQLHHTVSDTDS
jgi:hypothetical protein